MSNYNMTATEQKNFAIAQKNNNTYERFISKYGNRSIEQVSNADPGQHPWNRKFRGPESDRYVLDPKNPNGRVIDMQHLLACAQIPGGLGSLVGLGVEVQQFFKGFKSAFTREDLTSNRLGDIFGQYYLNNSSKGKTLGEQLRTFFQDYQNNTWQFQASTPEARVASTETWVTDATPPSDVTASETAVPNYDLELLSPALTTIVDRVQRDGLGAFESAIHDCAAQDADFCRFLVEGDAENLLTQLYSALHEQVQSGSSPQREPEWELGG